MTPPPIVPPPPPASSSGSSKFREHLSLSFSPTNTVTNITRNQNFIEKSQFSPETPSPPPESLAHQRSTTSSNTTMPWSFRPGSRSHDTVETRSPTTARGIRDRFTRIFFDARTLGATREPELPIQHPWPPLHIEKRQRQCTCDHNDPRRRRCRTFASIALTAFLLFLFVNIVALNVRVIAMHSPPAPSPTPSYMSTSTSGSTSTSPTILSSAQQQCLSQYTLNAPTNPTAYSCSTCLPALQSVPLANFSNTDPTDADQVQNGIQFCGLRAIFDGSDQTGQQGLSAAGWIKDVRFCAWGGVSCDGAGRVSRLQLTSSGIPTSLPSAASSALTGLTNFTVTASTSSARSILNRRMLSHRAALALARIA